jgi:hypothetical protein
MIAQYLDCDEEAGYILLQTCRTSRAMTDTWLNYCETRAVRKLQLSRRHQVVLMDRYTKAITKPQLGGASGGSVDT